MKPLMHAAIAALAVSVGIFSGRLIPHPGSDSGQSPRPSQPSRSAASEAPAPALSGNKEDRKLAQLRNLTRRLEEDPLGLDEQMQRLGADALKDMASALATESSLAGEDGPASSEIIKAALRQLYRLEGLAAVEWVSGWSEPVRQMGMEEILAIAARDNVAAAKPWIDQHETKYGRSWTSNFYSQAMKGGKERSAEDLIKVCDAFPPGSRPSIRDLLGNFADDFDFEAAFSALRGKKDLQDLIHYWAARDKQAAWTSLKADLMERGRPASYSFHRFATGVITKEGEERGLKTLIGLIGELPDEQRDLCLRNLHGGMLTTSGIKSVIPELSVSDRKAFAEDLISSHNAGEGALIMLDSLPREEMIAALENSFTKNRGMLDAQNREFAASGIGRVSDEIELRYSLTPDEMARIRNARGF